MKKKIMLGLLSLSALVCLSSCTNTEYTDDNKAVFYLEGGKIKGNEREKIVYDYHLQEGEETLIVDPYTIKESLISYDDHYIEGWYLIEDGIKTDIKWDFTTDKMTSDGIKLYAKWKKNIAFTYDIYCKVNNEDVLIHSYEVNKDETFIDRDNKIAAYEEEHNCTFYKYTDEEGKAFDLSYKHEGNDSNPNKKIYVEFIEGDYTVVRTASELKKALTSTSKKGIYIDNDIDMDTLSSNTQIFVRSFEDKKIIGNGHKISNLVLNSNINNIQLKVDGSDTGYVYVSLFYKMKNSTISDLNIEFKDFKISGSFSKCKGVYIAPLAASIENCTISNVNLLANYEIDTRFNQELLNLDGVNNGIYYQVENNTIENLISNINSK